MTRKATKRTPSTQAARSGRKGARRKPGKKRQAAERADTPPPSYARFRDFLFADRTAQQAEARKGRVLDLEGGGLPRSPRVSDLFDRFAWDRLRPFVRFLSARSRHREARKKLTAAMNALAAHPPPGFLDLDCRRWLRRWMKQDRREILAELARTHPGIDWAPPARSPLDWLRDPIRTALYVLSPWAKRAAPLGADGDALTDTVVHWRRAFEARCSGGRPSIPAALLARAVRKLVAESGWKRGAAVAVVAWHARKTLGWRVGPKRAQEEIREAVADAEKKNYVQ